MASWSDKIKERLSGKSSGESSSWANSIKERIAPSVQRNLVEKEDKRQKDLYDAQGVADLGNSLNANEADAAGFTGLGLFKGPQQTFRDVFTRESKDQEYLAKIDSNNKTIAGILKQKRENPQNAGDYDIMIKALSDKNKMLEEATGGALKDKTDQQLIGQAISTAADLTPVGAGVTNAGRQVLMQGGKRLIGSLLKEGAALGAVSGTGSVMQQNKEDITPSGALGEIVSSTLFGAVGNAIVGTAFNTLGEKVGSWLKGDKIEFTPKEKTFLEENVPEMSDEQMFQAAGIEPPLQKTDGDFLAKSIAETEDEGTIYKLLEGKVAEKDIPTVTRTLKAVKDEDTVAKILDEYNPVKAQEELALKVATTDNEKKIANLIKGKVAEADIPAVSRALKNVEDETEAARILDEFKIKETTKIETPETPQVEPVKQVRERDLSDAELVDTIKNKEIGNFTTDSSRDIAKRKGIELKYSSLKKRVQGNYTKKEFNNTKKELESSFIGKEVTVNGKPGTISKGSFGKVGVDFGNGEIKYFAKDVIKSKPVTMDDVVQRIVDNAKKELKDLNGIFQMPRTVQDEIPTPKAPKTTTEKLSSPQENSGVKAEPKGEVSQSPKIETPQEPSPTPKEPPKKLETDQPKEAQKATERSKTNKSSLITTLKKNAEARGIKLDKVDIPRLKSKMSLDEERKKAFSYFLKNQDEAVEMVLRGEAPEGIRPGSLYVVATDYANEIGDVDLAYQLSKTEFSDAAEMAAERGREVKAYDRGGVSNPSRVMQEVNKLKTQIIERSGVNVKDALKATAKELKAAIEKESSGDEGFSKLIKSIKC